MANKFAEFLMRFDKYTGHYAHVTYVNASPRINKGRGKNRNPFLGRLTKVTTIRIRSARYVPADEVDGERSARVQDNIEELSTYLIRYRSTGTVCFRCKPEDIVKSRWLVDGREATREEVEAIKPWLPAKGKPVEWLTLNVEKIHDIRMERCFVTRTRRDSIEVAELLPCSNPEPFGG